MAPEIIDIEKYDPRSSDIFFFDNNIWMFLFCPLAEYNKRKQRIYSSFLQRLQSARSTIFINSLIFSEFANANFRIDFDLWKNETRQVSAEFKKDYVGTERYQETAALIKNIINRILHLCEKSSDEFNAVDFSKVLDHLTTIDYNDSYYLELASLKDWKIVTDDKDFVKYKNHGCQVITIK